LIDGYKLSNLNLKIKIKNFDENKNYFI